MPLSDFFHALPFVLLVGVVPGIALTSLIAPRLSWPERMAAAPGFSAGCVGVIGLMLHITRLPFEPVTALPVLVVVVGAAVVRQLRQRGDAAPGGGVGWAATGAALIAGAVLVGVVAAAMHGQPLPPNSDPSVHATVAVAIVQDRDVLPIIPIPEEGSGFVRTELAFEATDALTSEIGAGAPAQVMLPLALVSLLALPLGVALLTHRVTRDRRVAAVAALLSLGLIFPAWPAGFGDYPYLVASTLVVPLVLAVARCLDGEGLLAGAAMAGAAVLAMWVTHGLEIPTAVAIGAFLWLSILVTRRRAALVGAATGLISVAVALGAGYVLTRSPAVALGHPSGPFLDEASAYLAQERGIGPGIIGPMVNLDLSILTGILLCAGAAAVVLQRRGRWLLGSLVVPVLCAVDVAGPQWLLPLWVRAYPWTDMDRLYGLEYFVVPVLAAIGAAGLLDIVSHRVASRRARVWSTAAMAVAAGGGLVIGGLRTSAMLSDEISMSVPAPAQDLAVIQDLATVVPTGSLILNDGDADAGMWIDALTGDVEVEPGAYAGSYPDDWRLVALASACTDPTQAERALAGIQAVFVGSNPLPGDVHAWRVGCIAALPGLRLVSGSTAGAAGFVVRGAAG